MDERRVALEERLIAFRREAVIKLSQRTSACIFEHTYAEITLWVYSLTSDCYVCHISIAKFLLGGVGLTARFGYCSSSSSCSIPPSVLSVPV